MQADVMTVAVVELQGAATINRQLWEKAAERGRTLLLAALALCGGAARGAPTARMA